MVLAAYRAARPGPHFAELRASDIYAVAAGDVASVRVLLACAPCSARAGTGPSRSMSSAGALSSHWPRQAVVMVADRCEEARYAVVARELRIAGYVIKQRTAAATAIGSRRTYTHRLRISLSIYQIGRHGFSRRNGADSRPAPALGRRAVLC
jgi:hypothetical protein